MATQPTASATVKVLIQLYTLSTISIWCRLGSLTKGFVFVAWYSLHFNKKNDKQAHITPHLNRIDKGCSYSMCLSVWGFSEWKRLHMGLIPILHCIGMNALILSYCARFNLCSVFLCIFVTPTLRHHFFVKLHVKHWYPDSVCTCEFSQLLVFMHKIQDSKLQSFNAEFNDNSKKRWKIFEEFPCIHIYAPHSFKQTICFSSAWIMVHFIHLFHWDFMLTHKVCLLS